MTTVQVVPRAVELPVAQLTFDSDVQCRESIQMGVVAEYKESLAAGVVFPPLVVFFDGKTNWVADGFHRGHAYRDTGVVTCPCDVRQGSKRDAILYACGANASHGLKRTNADKRRAVLTLLRDAEWRKESSRWIAEKCGVSHFTVQAAKNEMAEAARFQASSQVEDSSTSEPARVTGSDGKSYPAKRKPNEKLIEKLTEEPPVERTEEKSEAVEAPRPSHVGLVAISDDDGEEEEGGDEDQPSEDARKVDESNEATEFIRNAKRSISEIWFRCPRSSRWRLKAGIENHLSDLSEG